MVNSKEFSSRLKRIIDYYEESASSFADNIGVQRSSISHILSGRNKPSLDFVMKILDSYPEVGLYWLLNGKGDFPESTSSATGNIKQEEETPKNNNETPAPDLFSNIKNTPNDKTIERIVIFFNDGSFKSYSN
ncbi:helix-turn-helix domain-containing protein [Mangrovimonas spongiae]|uniref:XRE family transcriptional regulator n=1 Tax=Mangrovimonas spongiae TaxID=2494697 RepID=A0A428JWU7_9FLAO|nr:helix-turn-helix transcriptional regulator [Mangrovimonas spongiae]RSK38588.1 XRE family transcriptional regulator [Mangrovimonas spongiae]